MHLTKKQLFDLKPIFTGDVFEVVRRSMVPRDTKKSGIKHYGMPYSGWRAYLKENGQWNRYYIQIEVENYDARPLPWHYLLHLEASDVKTVYCNRFDKSKTVVSEMSSGGVEYSITQRCRVEADQSKITILHTMRQPGERAHVVISFSKTKYKHSGTEYKIRAYAHPRSAWFPFMELFKFEGEWGSMESFETPLQNFYKWIKDTFK